MSSDLVSPLEAEPRPGAETSFEIELDEQPPATHAPVYVDVVSRDHDRRPIVPAALRSLAGVRAAAKHTAGRHGHIAAYHAVRLPFWYVPLAAFWSLVGAAKIVWRLIPWWLDGNALLMEQKAVNNDDHLGWSKARKEGNSRRLFRGIVLAICVVAVAAGVAALRAYAPLWAQVLVVATAVPWLAHVGRPDGRPIVRSAVVTPRYRRLNSDTVLRAYYAAKLGHPDKPGQQIEFGSTMSRDALNKGSQVVVNLPFGTTFDDAVKVKAALASGLDVTSNQVFLTRDKQSDRSHTLYVADVDPLAIPVGRTDMLDLKPRNIWRPIRIGKDERDQLVSLSLVFLSILIGAQPRKGKTFFVRLILLFAALDPYVRILLADGKKSADYDKFRLVAHRMVIGDAPNPRDNDPLTHLIDMLDEILAHIAKVNDILSGLPVEMCPEGKLTEQLARDPRYPELRVWIVAMEEFQVYFETEDKDINQQVAQKLQRIMAQGPSAGVTLLSSSQKPSGVGGGQDVARLFNRYRDNHQIRFALKCGNRIVSEAILGGDAYSEGYDASSLPVGDGQNGTNDYRGVGILYGASDRTPTVRTFLADHQDAEKILIAARGHRERAGTLSGLAAGEDMSRQVRDVLADVRRVYYAGEAWISWPQIAARLREQLPEHYADVTGEALSAQLRALGVESRNGRDKFDDNRVVKGAHVAAVEQAMERRALESGR